tara:strand:- start:22582 stop:22773 length:192 start_codon:yes stop_codon:yes gene_type:complete
VVARLRKAPDNAVNALVKSALVVVLVERLLTGHVVGRRGACDIPKGKGAVTARLSVALHGIVK